MRKKTIRSNSQSKKPPNKRRKSAIEISRELNRVLKQYKVNYMTYEQARDFTHQFIDSLFIPMLESWSDFEKERHLTASKEIMCEIIREKYSMGNREACVLLLHAGISLLETIDNDGEF